MSDFLPDWWIDYDDGHAGGYPHPHSFGRYCPCHGAHYYYTAEARAWWAPTYWCKKPFVWFRVD